MTLCFDSRRSTVYARHGMVATSQPLASQAGLTILQNGGNAIDAAIAIAAALSVTEPCSTGLGGDCFLLYYEASTKKMHALNGSGRAPQALNIAQVQQDCDVSSGSIPITHAHAVTVPGAVDGWLNAMELWGTKTIQEVLQPAITLAQEGFPVSEITAHHWKAGEWQLKLFKNHEELLINGSAPQAGELFSNPNVARCLQEIATDGRNAFYSGRIAKCIIDELAVLGGVMTLQDLEQHATTFPEPISVTFRDVQVFEVPPNGQGLAALLAFNLLSQLLSTEDTKLPIHNSSEYLHLLIEVMRIAFSDTRYYVSDPNFGNIPITELLSETYSKLRASLFCPQHCTVDPIHGSPTLSSDTVSFQVVDGKGNAVSMVNSNYTGFGTGITPKGCGFSLQSRGSNFSLDENHPNALQGNKRPYHTIIPAMSLKGNVLHASFTVMGGFMQPQGHVQVLCNLLLFSMTPQRALDVPRFCIGSGHMGSEGKVVSVEDGVDSTVIKELEEKGHTVRIVSGHARSLFGRGQIIVQNPHNAVLSGGSDGRSDGCVLGY